MEKNKKKSVLTVKEMAVFSMLGALMYATKVLMEFLPNVHLLCMFVITFTVVYRVKALFPIYVYVLINGLFAGFSMWWMPYLYIWAIPWGITMLLPKKMKPGIAVIVYAVVCSLHGFLFGTLYAPAQALMFGLNFKRMVAWIIAGLPYDMIHGVSNFFMGFLIVPISTLLKRMNRILYAE